MSTRVLFVCLGNICRSPLAEGLFKKHVYEAGVSAKYSIDSSGTSGYHRGALPDIRTRENASKNGLELTHCSRQFTRNDFYDFDIILVMDSSNRNDVLSMEPSGENDTAQVFMMRDFDHLGKGQDVPDPYHGGERGFQEVYEMLERSTKNLLDILESPTPLSSVRNSG